MPRTTSRRSRRPGIQNRKRRPRKMASPAEAKLPNNSSGKEEGANVDKIRDILFGSQMRDYEKRFARLEENVSESRRDSPRRHHEAPRNSQQFRSNRKWNPSASALKTEKSERSEGLKELARELKDAAKMIEKKTSASSKNRRPTRKAKFVPRLLENSKAVLERNSTSCAATPSASLDREVEALRQRQDRSRRSPPTFSRSSRCA